MYLSIHLSIHLSIYLSIHPSIHPSIYLSIHLSIYLSIYRYIYRSAYRYISYRDIPIYISIRMHMLTCEWHNFLHPPVDVWLVGSDLVYLSIYLSFYLHIDIYPTEMYLYLSVSIYIYTSPTVSDNRANPLTRSTYRCTYLSIYLYL